MTQTLGGALRKRRNEYAVVCHRDAHLLVGYLGTQYFIGLAGIGFPFAQDIVHHSASVLNARRKPGYVPSIGRFRCKMEAQWTFHRLGSQQEADRFGRPCPQSTSFKRHDARIRLILGHLRSQILRQRGLFGRSESRRETNHPGGEILCLVHESFASSSAVKMSHGNLEEPPASSRRLRDPVLQRLAPHPDVAHPRGTPRQ